MLDLDAISKKNIALATAREALTQCEKRLGDLLEEKKSLETKATTVFSAFVGIATTVFGVGTALVKSQIAGIIPAPFFMSGVCFVVAAMMLIMVIAPRPGGYLGSTPDWWLKDGYIDTDEASGLPRALAYMVFHYKNRIDEANASNQGKRYWFVISLFVGLFGALAIAAGLIFTVP